MQVMPGHFASGEDPYATSTNLAAGCRWLTRCWDWAQGSTSTALKCYTGGTNRSGWGPRTHAFPERVLSCMPKMHPPTVEIRPPLQYPELPHYQALGTAGSTPVYWDPSCEWRYTDGSCRRWP